MENLMTVTKLRLYWWAFLVFLCSLGITYQVNMSHKPPISLPTPLQTLEHAKVLPPLQNPVIACSSEPKCSLLAEAIVYETRGEPDIGKVAVAHVILNRKQDPRWGNSIRDVIHQPRQFSYLKDKHKQTPPTNSDWITARKIAHGVISGTISNPVGEATHYHAARVKPKWAKKLEPVAKIGQHIFYR